jgi:putative membrane protein
MLPVVPAIPSLHAGEPDPTGFLFSSWTLQAGIALGLFALLAGYVWLAGPAQRRKPEVERRTASRGQRAAFVGGVATLLIALGPPLEDWAEHYLLTAHMVQHMLLMLLAPPLLLLGTPGWMFEPLTRNRITNALGFWLTRPLIAYALSSITLIAWHLPVLYEAALYSDPLHSLEHGLFLGTSLLMWWPVLGSLPQWPRISPLLQCLYFFALTIPGVFVGAFITLAQPGLYRPYDTAPRVFGIDVATDQQLAGLLMWVGEGVIFLLLITITFLRWSSAQEAADRARPATRRSPSVASGPPAVPAPTPSPTTSGVPAEGS